MPLSAKPWRIVEGQHVVSTRRLVDSAEEQALLEEMIDSAKPKMPAGPEFKGLHYLLFTPFRHPPLRYGSRFGTRAERGIWYGSERPETALAECAYYRFVFLAGTRAVMPRMLLEMSLFQAEVRTRRGIDLSRPPFAAHERALRSKTSYETTQRLGSEMRAAGIEAFRYRSARDPLKGTNIGVFTPRAFARKDPREPQVWLADVTAERVEFTRKNVVKSSENYLFERRQFLVGKRLPAPAT